MSLKKSRNVYNQYSFSSEVKGGDDISVFLILLKSIPPLINLMAFLILLTPFENLPNL